MNDADRKVNEIFAGLVVRKDLAKEIRGNLAVPNYVLEYLLGQYCATAEEDDIKAGVEQVKEILRQHFVRTPDRSGGNLREEHHVRRKCDKVSFRHHLPGANVKEIADSHESVK